MYVVLISNCNRMMYQNAPWARAYSYNLFKALMAWKKQMRFQQNPQVTNKTDTNQKGSYLRKACWKSFKLPTFPRKRIIYKSQSLWIGSENSVLNMILSCLSTLCAKTGENWETSVSFCSSAPYETGGCQRLQSNRGALLRRSFHPGSATNPLWTSCTHLFQLLKQIPQWLAETVTAQGIWIRFPGHWTS